MAPSWIVFAAGYTVLRRVVPEWKPLAMSVTVAALGFWALSLFPFIRYPLVPPGAGDVETLTMVGQFLIWALMAAGVIAGLYWYEQRNEKAVKRFDPVTGSRVNT